MLRLKRVALACATLACLSGTVAAFAPAIRDVNGNPRIQSTKEPPNPGTPSVAPVRGKLYSTRLLGTTKYPPIIPMPRRISYGEESRKYRRTIYTHDDWIKHRAPNRFFNRALSIFTSGIYANIKVPVFCVTSIAVLTVLWNAMVGQWTGLRGVKHAGILASSCIPTAGLPMAPFTLSSASLGLLLVFRTNTGYSRWDEARKNWGMNINRTRDLFRMSVAWYDDKAAGVGQKEREKDLIALAQSTWAFVRCMKRHLSPRDDEEYFAAELHQKLPEQQAKSILAAKHRPNRALFDLSMAIENLPMHFLRKSQLHVALTKFEDNLGSSERLLSSPVPLFYSRHTARFLLFWTLGLPLALYKEFANSWNHILLIPASAFIATFLFGIEELANQMEEPFTILPQQAFCDNIFTWCMEMVAWRPGDNGLEINEYAKAVHYANGGTAPNSAFDETF